MLDLFSGFYGILLGVLIPASLGGWFAWKLKGRSPFNFDPEGKEGAFEKILSIYLDILKFVLGLSSGSIVLLAGSSAFRAEGKLPPYFASPLFLLLLSIIYGVICMIFLTANYEGSRHKTTNYTLFKYARNLSFGYGSIA
jgi:uncharacterized Tic20 family protein